MMSVGLPQHEAEDMIAILNAEAHSFGMCIACINSPSNITVAGESRLIDKLKTQLDESRVFARKLRVPVAYHSKQMEEASRRYRLMIQSVKNPQVPERTVPMISTVTGRRAGTEELADPSYWALNMTSLVLFPQAITKMCKQSEVVKKIDGSHLFASVVDHLIEVGPHATLQGPLRDILQTTARGKTIFYNSILKRNQSAVDTMLSAIGHLHCIGYPVKLRAVNAPFTEDLLTRQPSLLVDLPEYPFDHSQRYWEESRLSKNYRLRSHPPTSLLGVRSRDWNLSEARWRLIIRNEEMPWTEQHIVNGLALYPAAGMLVMAIEAAKQLGEEIGTVHSYIIRDVLIKSPIDLRSASGRLEVQTHLHELENTGPETMAFKFTVRTWVNEQWILNCRGFISVELSVGPNSWVEQKNTEQRRAIANGLKALKHSCAMPVDDGQMYRFLKQCGYDYGPDFRAAQHQCFNAELDQATATVGIHRSSEDRHVIHPVSLDAILHLAFTALSGGGSKPMATSIPHRIGSLWVSSEGLSWPDRSTVTACTSIREVNARGFFSTGGALSCDSPGQLLLWYDGFELVNITSKESQAILLPNPKQFCMGIEYKVTLDKLSSTEIRNLLRASHPITQDQSNLHRDVGLLVQVTLKQLVKAADLNAIKRQEPWKRYYLDWARHHLKEHGSESGLPNTHNSIQDLKNYICTTSRMGRVYAEVSANLIAIFNDEVYPLELLLESGLLRNGYEEWAEYDCAKQAAHYIDLLAHQKPGMKILEVGGGTGATTRNFTNALRAYPGVAKGSLRCKRYEFTDISSNFIEKAREEFADMASQMTFKKLNIEEDFPSQGFPEASYDLIVADNVLHVTSNLEKTLHNVRRALRAGGKLVLHELLTPTGWTTGFIFGVFPGWWLGVEDGRRLSPNLTSEQWDKILKASGFSGVDITLVDSDTDDAHQVGWLVATATEDDIALSPVASPHFGRQAFVIMDKSSEQQRILYDEMLLPLRNLFGSTPHIFSLENAADSSIEPNEDILVILLLDYGPSFLASSNEMEWKQMSSVIQKSHRLLWVSAGGGWGASPDHGLLDGLARTLRSEYYNLHLVTVALESLQARGGKGEQLSKIAREMLDKPTHESYEQDYTEINGLLHTRRLIEARHLKSNIDERVLPYEVIPTSHDGELRFKASTSSFLGSDQTPHYVRVYAHSPEMIAADFVEIVVQAVSLQPGDRNTYLEEKENSTYGSYCSGTVLRTGSGCSFIPGDRVIVAHSGSFRSHVCAHRNFVARFSTALSFTDACIAVPPVVSAYTAFVEVGRIKYGESVLVHGGATYSGQVIIQLLKDQGVTDLWTTADSEDASSRIKKRLQLPEQRILPKSWFETHSNLTTLRKQQFDVVFSEQGNSSQLIFDCVNSGGRFVRFDSRSKLAKDRHTMLSAPADISLITVPTDEAKAEALEYAASVSLHVPPDLSEESTIYPASDLISIFSDLRSSSDHKTIVVRLNESDNVLVS